MWAQRDEIWGSRGAGRFSCRYLGRWSCWKGGVNALTMLARKFRKSLKDFFLNKEVMCSNFILKSYP